jgi:putative ABC transport system permease protein
MTGFRFAIRQLWRNPLFSAVVVLTLALGTGASTLMFSVIEGVLLGSLPYPQPERIVRVFEVDENGRRSRPSDPNFMDLKDQNRSFVAFAQFGEAQQPVSGGSESARVPVAIVSREFFDVLGVAPALGRTFVPEELAEGAPPAALVSHAFWQRYLGGRPDFASRTLTIGDTTYAIVGVLPLGFAFPNGADVWTPAELWPITPSRTSHNYEAIARLAPGITAAQAQEDLGAIATRLKQQHGGDIRMQDASVISLHDLTVSGVRPALLVLAAAVGLLYLVACANVVSMLLARAVSRKRELAVRVALGAGSGRIAAQFLTEMLTLCTAAGIIGVAVAAWGTKVLVALAARMLPSADSVGVDWTVLGFATGLVVLTATGSSLLMAWRAIGTGAPLGDSRRTVAGSRRSWMRDGLVASQVGLSLVLLVGTVLLGRSFIRLMNVDPGFRTSDIVFMDVSVAWPRDRSELAPLAIFHEQLLDRLRALPGVESIGGITMPPLAGSGWNGQFVELAYRNEIENFEDFGVVASDPARTMEAEYRIASGDYFSTLEIPLLRGRTFSRSDGPTTEHVAVVSQSLAERRWPGQNPLGKLIQYGNMDGDLTPFRVVGVVGDVREFGLDATPRPTFYGYYRQRVRSLINFSLAMRTTNAGAVVQATRDIVQSMRPELAPVFTFSEDLFSESIAQRRFNLVMLGVFGGVSLLLAVAGVYGAIAFNVAQRTREIGVRIALGAQGNRVVALVLRRSLAIAGFGVAAGVAVALGTAQLMETLLYGVTPYDPIAYGAAAVASFVSAAAAASIPALRAARVDPMSILREE